MFIQFKVVVRLDNIHFSYDSDPEDSDYEDADYEYQMEADAEELCGFSTPWTLDIKIRKELWDDMREEERMGVYEEYLEKEIEKDYRWDIDDIELSVLSVAK